MRLAGLSQEKQPNRSKLFNNWFKLVRNKHTINKYPANGSDAFVYSDLFLGFIDIQL
jgi:hypothetical protein